jgi:hypothetical protein
MPHSTLAALFQAHSFASSFELDQITPFNPYRLVFTLMMFLFTHSFLLFHCFLCDHSENGQPLSKNALKKLEKERLKKERAEKDALARAAQAAAKASATVVCSMLQLQVDISQSVLLSCFTIF